MFDGMHNGERDLAMRAGVALVVRGLVESSSTIRYEYVGYAAHDLVGAPVGLLSSSSSRWTRYAEAVEMSIQEEGAQSVNTRWGSNFTAVVAESAEDVADIILAAITGKGVHDA